MRGGRRGAVDEVGLELEVVDTEVLGVVAVTSPGEGVDMSAISAEGDSEDMSLCVSIANPVSDVVLVWSNRLYRSECNGQKARCGSSEKLVGGE